MVRLSKWLIAVGAVILVISVVAGIVLAVMGFSRVADIGSQAFDIDGSTSRHFDADESIQLYVAGTQDHPADSLPTCTVSGPAPTRPGPSQSSTFTRNHSSITSFASYTFTEAGTYQITCDSPGVVAAPPVSVSGILSGVGGILLAVFGGLAGAVLAVLGVVVRITSRKRSQTPPPPAGHAPPPYPPTTGGI